jgi:hypothetical protein
VLSLRKSLDTAAFYVFSKQFSDLGYTLSLDLFFMRIKFLLVLLMIIRYLHWDYQIFYESMKTN